MELVMIEGLEAEAVAHLVAAERGETRAKATLDDHGTTIEVRARRRKDGAVVLGYSYGGARLERAVLLLLICPVAACERSQSAKSQWKARNPAPPVLQRRSRNAVTFGANGAEARLFDEVPVNDGKGLCVARPASFAVHVACPVNAHKPVLMTMKGWDLFTNGKYMAGGLICSDFSGAKVPRFGSIEAANVWLSTKTV